MKDKAGIRFNPNKYAELELEENIILKTIIDGVVETYNVKGGGDGDLLFHNPRPDREMLSVTIKSLEEVLTYSYLKVVLTDTAGSFETTQWIETNIFQEESQGEALISMKHNGSLYSRRLYRTNGLVKISTAVYINGGTDQDKTCCIVKDVYGII